MCRSLCSLSLYGCEFFEGSVSEEYISMWEIKEFVVVQHLIPEGKKEYSFEPHSFCVCSKNKLLCIQLR